ncbi:hypothetical protein Tco_0664658 [Tanacetum coccineum]
MDRASHTHNSTGGRGGEGREGGKGVLGEVFYYQREWGRDFQFAIRWRENCGMYWEFSRHGREGERKREREREREKEKERKREREREREG